MCCKAVNQSIDLSLVLSFTYSAIILYCDGMTAESLASPIVKMFAKTQFLIQSQTVGNLTTSNLCCVIYIGFQSASELFSKPPRWSTSISSRSFAVAVQSHGKVYLLNCNHSICLFRHTQRD